MSAPLDSEEFARWRDHADGAAAAAEASAAAGAWNWACFLFEQRAQFAIKGLLHAVGLDAWGHDLVGLSDRLASALEDTWPRDICDAAVRLSRHYIPARYPDAHASGTPAQHYTETDAVDARADSGAIVAAVDSSWRELAGES